MRGVPWLLVCALSCASSLSAAQATGSRAAVVDERAGVQSAGVEQRLVEARLALERAQFSVAEQLLNDVFRQRTLSAAERNDALELAAIVQIAARREAQARDTLRLLMRRDPEHPRKVADPGPSVDAAFGHARQLALDLVDVRLSPRLVRDATQRLELHVALTAEQADARDAVQDVHVFVGAESGAQLAHLVGEVAGSSALRFLLPEPELGGRALRLHVEARAPSGVVLGQLGEPSAPLALTVPEQKRTRLVCPLPAKEPLRRAWWLWTSVGLVISGFAVASAVALQ